MVVFCSDFVGFFDPCVFTGFWSGEWHGSGDWDIGTRGIFLVLLFWRRPYDGRGANIVNAMIAVVRVLSIICILVFVEQLGMDY
jgi:hypothetical protein